MERGIASAVAAAAAAVGPVANRYLIQPMECAPYRAWRHHTMRRRRRRLQRAVQAKCHSLLIRRYPAIAAAAALTACGRPWCAWLIRSLRFAVLHAADAHGWRSRARARMHAPAQTHHTKYVGGSSADWSPHGDAATAAATAVVTIVVTANDSRQIYMRRSVRMCNGARAQHGSARARSLHELIVARARIGQHAAACVSLDATCVYYS